MFIKRHELISLGIFLYFNFSLKKTIQLINKPTKLILLDKPY